MLSGAGSISPIRQLATVKQTMSNTWQGVTSAGASSEWKTEGAEAADGAPTLASGRRSPCSCRIRSSGTRTRNRPGRRELPRGALARILADSLDNLHAVAYTTGNGTSAPQGIVTGLAAPPARSTATAPRRSPLPTRTRCRTRSRPGSRRGPRRQATSRRRTTSASSRRPTVPRIPRTAETPPSLLGKPLVPNEPRWIDRQRRRHREQLPHGVRRHRQGHDHRRPGRRKSSN